MSLIERELSMFKVKWHTENREKNVIHDHFFFFNENKEMSHQLTDSVTKKS